VAASKALLSIHNASKGTCLAENARLANDFFARLRGLLFTSPLKPGEGLCLEGCGSIHMFGMTYAIDAVFIDRNDLVVGLVENIKPWMMSRIYGQACRCLEIPVGTISATATTIGDRLEIKTKSSLGKKDDGAERA
jgi:uncharacterized membrane protein (UPF0127 family)